MHVQLEACVYMEGMQQLLEELSVQDVQMHAMSNYPVWYQDINAKLHIDRCSPAPVKETLHALNDMRPYLPFTNKG